MRVGSTFAKHCSDYSILTEDYIVLIFFVVSHRYTEITNFLQGYIDNEANLNEKGSCTESCEDYTRTRRYGCTIDTPCHPERHGVAASACDGVIRDCLSLPSDLRICEAVCTVNFFQNSQ